MGNGAKGGCPKEEFRDRSLDCWVGEIAASGHPNSSPLEGEDGFCRKHNGRPVTCSCQEMNMSQNGVLLKSQASPQLQGKVIYAVIFSSLRAFDAELV